MIESEWRRSTQVGFALSVPLLLKITPSWRHTVTMPLLPWHAWLPIRLAKACFFLFKQKSAYAQRAQSYITDHLNERLTHDQLARAMHVSPGHLSRVFKASVGVATSQYISYQRYSYAKKLLSNPSMRVSDVAFEVGFQSLSQFNRTFRQIGGMSPSEYRYQTGMQQS